MSENEHNPWQHKLLEAYAKTLPTLELRAANAKLTRAEQREQLRALVAWLATRRGFQSQRHAPVRYFEVPGQWIGGRLDIAVRSRDDRPVLAIELDWRLTRASVCKLAAARVAGYHTLWIVDLDGAREQADVWLKKPTASWLAIYRLGSGPV